ncbi:MAG: plasmid pRiA4b ORF-3 family protein [Deltaproteobacteria bacterium]|nr:plasmid pRiA4b ORF-3 family protein [Deltaproteobacteria bacterium]
MPKYYEFDVSLQQIQPRIWRRFLLRTNATFEHLHHAIQDGFDWQDCHLWEFRLPTRRGFPIAGIVDDEELGRPTPDAKLVKLGDYFTGARVAERCEYVYDFGDDWTHDVKLVGVHSDKATFKRRLLAGERAAPPEDSGGLPGYERIVRFVETGRDAYGDDPAELRTWLGPWQPEAFDLRKAKAAFDR